jgi:DNA polymerase-3 subunit beta
VLTDSDHPFVLPVLPVARLNNLLSGTVTMNILPGRIDVRCAQSVYEIATYETVEEYPRTKDTPTVLATVPTNLLLELFSQVSYAVAKDDLRPVLKGVQIILERDRLTAAATDSHRLVYKRVHLPTSVEEPWAMTVPAEAFSLLQRVHTLTDSDQCEICIGEECVAFQLQNGRVWTQLITGQYPNWERVVPQEARITVVAERDALLERLRRISIAVGDPPKIYLKFADILTISARSDRFARAEETMELAKPAEESIELAMNLNFLTQALKGFDEKTVTIELEAPLRPIKVYDSDPAMHAAVIMPMAL